MMRSPAALSTLVLCATVATPALGQEAPADAPFDEIVLGASDQLRITDRVLVRGVLTSTGPGATTFGTDNTIDGDVYSIADVNVGHRTDIDGSVWSSNNVNIANTASVTASFPGGLSGGIFTDGGLGGFGGPVTPVLTLPPDTTATLTDQFHDRVTVFSRSELVIPSGTWVIERLTVEPEATIRLDPSNGPVELVIGTSMTMRGAWEGITDSTDFDLVYTSSRNLLMERSFTGELRAPFADLTLAGNNTTFEGSFFAENILVRPGVTVRRDADEPAPTCECTGKPRIGIVWGD